MPNEEIEQLIKGLESYIPKEKQAAMFKRLDAELPQNLLSLSLEEVIDRAVYFLDPPPPPPDWWVKPLFRLLVVVHYILVVGVAASFFSLPFLAPWYVALPCMTFIFFFSTTKVECQCTNAENVLRQKLGMPRIHGFVSHYFKRPARDLYRRWFK